MEVRVDGTRVYTEGMAEYIHPELVAEAGSHELVEGAVSIVERLGEVVASGVKRFRDGERLSFQAALIELHEVDGALEMWEPDGDRWRPGIRRGLELLEDIEALSSAHSLDDDGIELNLVCSVSPRVGLSKRVTLRRRAAFSNHSGWEIVAAEDEGNPACLAHPTLASLWKRETRLLPYICLPVGAEVRWEEGRVEIGYPREAPKPVWEEPDEVWAHHDPADAENADWMVTGRLGARRPGVPTWEWLPLRRTGPDTGVICAVPFLLHGLALGDEVRVDEHGVIDKRVRQGGRAALRVEFTRREESPVVEELRRREIHCEWMNDVVLAIDCDSERRASELMTWLDEREECSIISHSLAHRPRPLTSEVNDAAIRTALGVGGSLALFGGLWADGGRDDRLTTAATLALVNSFALWCAAISRWVVSDLDVRRPRWHEWRMFAVSWLCFGGILLALATLALDMAFPFALLVAGSLGATAVALTDRHYRSPVLPKSPGGEIPPPFYRYAKASVEGGRIEILVGEDGASQALVARYDRVESRSYRSFYEAASELSAEFDVGRGSWWYAR